MTKTTRHIVLLGFMAAGKSTVGEALARRLRRTFIDTDVAIESEYGSIADIFATQGESVFRRYEHDTIASALARTEPCVIAVGGGAPAHAPTRMLLQKAFRVFLHVDPEHIAQRVAEAATVRPMLGGMPSRERIDTLYRERLPLYERAEVTIMCGAMSPDAIARDVEQALQARGVV